MEVLVRKLADDELATLDVKRWPVWEKEESTFSWHYDEQETCFFLEGEADIETANGAKVSITKGDFVIFPRGLDCVWHIKRKVRKHYRFG